MDWGDVNWPNSLGLSFERMTGRLQWMVEWRVRDKLSPAVYKVIKLWWPWRDILSRIFTMLWICLSQVVNCFYDMVYSVRQVVNIFETSFASWVECLLTSLEDLYQPHPPSEQCMCKMVYNVSYTPQCVRRGRCGILGLTKSVFRVSLRNHEKI